MQRGRERTSKRLAFDSTVVTYRKGVAMRVLITHAYSATNAGDGLLVTEAVGIAREAFPESDIEVVALDAPSFEGFQGAEVLPLLDPSRRPIVAAATRAMPFRQRQGTFDLIIAVGGGYLRGGRLLESVKTGLIHHAQLPRSSGVPTIYLPQSIGPFRGGQRRLYVARLKNAAHVFVRDDRSLAEISVICPTRAPDLALLRMATGLDVDLRSGNGPSGHVGVVYRQLAGSRRRTRRYLDGIRELTSTVGAELLVQAEARGNNDRDFYEAEWGPGPYRRMLDAVSNGAQDRPNVVISVRLHGALQSILSGVPAIHLSYERKGWGAFEDLGIGSFVHNALDFDPLLVQSQLSALQEDSSGYWAAVDGAMGQLLRRRTDIVESVRALGARV